MLHFKRIPALLCALVLSAELVTGCGITPLGSHSEDSLTVTTALTQTGTSASETAETTVSRPTDAQTQTDSNTDTQSDSRTTEPTESASSSAAAGSTANSGGRQTVQSRSASGTKRSSSASGRTDTGQESDTRTTETETTAAVTEIQLPSVPADLHTILSGMTLKQKAAQMMFVGITSETTAREAAAAGVGGLCMFALPFKNKTKEQVRIMDEAIQSRAAIPLIMAADEEGGPINRLSLNSNLRAEPFPAGKTLYANGGWDSVISDTEEKAELLKSLGINTNLAPVADVPLSSKNYIYNRCFSLDAKLTAEYIKKVVTVMEQKHFGSTLKHFPGYGGSVDTHKNMGYDSRSYSAFENGDFLPFIAGIQAGADAVMVSHNIVKCMDDKNPASLSAKVHQILRETLGFEGVVISDDLGMNAITLFTNGKNPAVAAVLAGNDFIAYADYKNSISAIVKAVQNGTISESRLDASVLRILNWKRELGLI